MKNVFSLILGILAIGNFIYSFWGNATEASIFFVDVNIWVYRAFWLAIAVAMLYKFIKGLKEPTQNGTIK